ncbi:hypothetical protein [Streptomyces sp. NPDC046909]|uniref:hypothetical protein n=1 Tax=Streptomyces sp. NPDC046909 TaxID=3155617 RepID=UPI0033D3AC83
MGEARGKHGMHGIAKFHDYTGQRVEVKPHSEADVYHLARFRVTGKVTEDLSGCRFRCRQGKTDYQQDLRCVAEIRLGPPLKIKD